MKLLNIGAALILTSALGACTHKATVADINLGGILAKEVRIPATMNTPGMTALAVPNGRPGGVNVAAVGGNGLGGDLIKALGSAAGGALSSIGGGARASVNVAATAVATNN